MTHLTPVTLMETEIGMNKTSIFLIVRVQKDRL